MVSFIVAFQFCLPNVWRRFHKSLSFLMHFSFTDESIKKMWFSWHFCEFQVNSPDLLSWSFRFKLLNEEVSKEFVCTMKAFIYEYKNCCFRFLVFLFPIFFSFSFWDLDKSADNWITDSFSLVENFSFTFLFLKCPFLGGGGCILSICQ